MGIFNLDQIRHTLALLCLAVVPACSGTGGVLYDFDGDGTLDEDDCAPDDDSIYLILSPF